jgi:hypothetical protein
MQNAEAKKETTELAEIQQTKSLTNVWENKDAFNQMLRASQMLSQTSIIPQNYQGKPQDCFVAIEMANRMGISPMVVMQNMYVVKGKPSWAGQACTMLINSCGKFRDVKHIYTGEKGTDKRGCYVEATRIYDNEIIQGVEVTMDMAKSEGWTSNPKWRNMPELMLAYRASAFFARVHCPEALMGVHTEDEIYDAYERPKTTAFEIAEEIDKEVAENDK